jgi:hypothetical protein
MREGKHRVLFLLVVRVALAALASRLVAHRVTCSQSQAVFP